ncbi:MAG: UDP-N-acetylmuramate dehydrogenase [Lachnospiraceae bacterium]|nr:UDP-N-acetylmuramate dehydrogenase [Lachnospiraceae bacterium]
METTYGVPTCAARFEARLERMREAGTLTYEKDASLKKASSFRIGGTVDYAVYPMTAGALAETVKAAKELCVPFRVFGCCTNVLFDDEGMRGCAIFLKNLDRVTVEGNFIAAEAGIPDTTLARIAMKQGLSGMEFLYGIPGSVGGAVYMNGGAYGGEIAQICRSVTALNLTTGETETREGEENGFGYRHSAYMDGNLIVLSAVFELTPGEPEIIRAAMEDLMARRREKQPLSYPSAGSFFKRCPPYFAGKLIEDTGLKGLTVGGAQVSEKHAGFVINRGDATSADVKALALLVIDRVREKYGVTLSREVEYVPVVPAQGGKK